MKDQINFKIETLNKLGSFKISDVVYFKYEIKIKNDIRKYLAYFKEDNLKFNPETVYTAESAAASNSMDGEFIKLTRVSPQLTQTVNDVQTDDDYVPEIDHNYDYPTFKIEQIFEKVKREIEKDNILVVFFSKEYVFFYEQNNKFKIKL